jgi:rhomboid family GlyGly-CTERM serine protease
MNAENPAGGLRATLGNLNFDGAHGRVLLGVLMLLGLVEVGGEASRRALSYDRAAIAAGEAWRLVTAHFVHLDAEHAMLNGCGVVLMWALFARDYSPMRWVAIYLASGLAVSAGLWLLNPAVSWYVGASGALHGVMAAGTLAHLRRGDFIRWLLAVIIVAKLSYEQYAGAMPFSGSGDTIIDAHLYGAVGGLALATVLASRGVTRSVAPAR